MTDRVVLSSLFYGNQHLSENKVRKIRKINELTNIKTNPKTDSFTIKLEWKRKVFFVFFCRLFVCFLLLNDSKTYFVVCTFCILVSFSGPFYLPCVFFVAVLLL